MWCSQTESQCVPSRLLLQLEMQSISHVAKDVSTLARRTTKREESNGQTKGHSTSRESSRDTHPVATVIYLQPAIWCAIPTDTIYGLGRAGGLGTS